MGLRCSVLGHRYGDRERVEERDERGDEIVVAIREVKTCERCGDELVVTESKEVRAVDGPAEPTPSQREPFEPETELPTAKDAEVEPDPTPDPTPEPEPGDDGIILPDESADREQGDWPADPIEEETESGNEAGATTDEEIEEWPERDDTEDEGFDAMTGEVDEEIAAEVIEAVANTEPAREGENTEAGFYRAAPMQDPADPSETDVHTKYYCPRCDWEAASLTTSVRRGDICPDCQGGYVAEREDD